MRLANYFEPKGVGINSRRLSGYCRDCYFRGWFTRVWPNSRLYVKRDIPDGLEFGLSERHSPCENDDLSFYFSKKVEQGI